jgi:hypothetical protein
MRVYHGLVDYTKENWTGLYRRSFDLQCTPQKILPLCILTLLTAYLKFFQKFHTHTEIEWWTSELSKNYKKIQVVHPTYNMSALRVTSQHCGEVSKFYCIHV